MYDAIKYSLDNFNPRPREEGDKAERAQVISDFNFNPRPREEGDRLYSLLDEETGISIHALVKRATKAKEWGWFR